MKTAVLKLYTWSVCVLDARERTARYRVIAQTKEEAEKIGEDLGRLGGLPGPLLAEARRQVFVEKDGRESAA